jgi:glucan phosphoethanolaminetransferase (alkaline phosphatase superfamily)
MIGRPDKERKYVRRINCYDSAVRYIDDVLEGLFDRLERRERPALVVFFADHGEAPLLGSGHESRLHSHFHVEVPLLLWSNEAYKAQHADRWSSFARNRTAPASLIDLSFTLADLAEI